jgi:hypothetical protein
MDAGLELAAQYPLVVGVPADYDMMQPAYQLS